MDEIVGRTVRMFLVEGKPTGSIIAEVLNWTGQVLVGPRSNLAVLLKRNEVQRPGVYLLADGSNEESLPSLYIGESDNVAGRIKMHDGQKEFEKVCIVTSKDANLTKAHVLYLESRLIQLAKSSGRAKVENARASDIRSLPESDRADMEYFLGQMNLVVPVLGFDFFRPAQQPGAGEPKVANAATEGIALRLSPVSHPDLARGFESDGEVIVLKGSKALTESYVTNDYAVLRQKLIDGGQLAADPASSSYLVFTQDVPFKSASAAASVILNHNANGRVEWKLADGRTLKKYQEAQLAAVDVPDNDQ